MCNPTALNAILSTLTLDLENPQRGSPKLADLPDADPPNTDPLGDGFGFYGTRDFDGNGTLDRVVLYTSVDYWLWLVFEERRGCEHFLGAVPGYHIDVQNTSHGGRRDLLALTYPIMGQNETYRFDGKEYVKH